ncbi:UDP-Glycosyltransferase/glycogen phosphorylase [Serendipita vermifera]|nr:UDP-Glycosyltransferase/glycogen phosphorylase [Serendipita vermifera]
MASTNNDAPSDQPSPYQGHMNESDEELTQESRMAVDEQQADFASYMASGKGLESTAIISKEGRIDVSVQLHKPLPDLPENYANPIREFAVDPHMTTSPIEGPREGGKVPRLSVVIMIVGSRGDVQPFLALGQGLQRHGHRVRIATHGNFRSFVTDAGLEFYSIGGDPHELMSYMVKNPGLIPGWESLTNGDIPKKQKMLSEILDGCWSACFQPDIDKKPFIADAIISNPPAFAHVHCAEALGIPLQLSFTMPWSPTVAFPHPLVNVSRSNAEPGLTNFLSYGLAEMMTWQGLGGVINDFRATRLGLEPLSVRSGPGIIDRLKVPWTYCFSPEIVPKPGDWQNHIDVVGFYFLDLASGYEPPPELAAFLAAGPAPIYIGFGSVVVEDPKEMTRVIFQATKEAGVRALLSVGWGGLGGTEVPPHIFLLGNVPHDWLFTKVSAVCHHGGAGTTAIGLRLGKPTIVVPFFGDQPFWGSMIHRAGAGPKPIKPERLDVERLKKAIEFCLTKEAKIAADKLGEQIRAQSGVQNGVESFHKHLPVLNMSRCDLLPDQLAVWWSAEHCLKLSAVAAEVLGAEGHINIHKLEIHRPKEYETRAKASDPITGGTVEEPKKGMINTTVAIPRSVLHILDSFTEGLYNTPSLWGSHVREPGRMKDFSSGMKEGGKAFLFGLSDGITGLWTEPAEGFKQKGWKGLMEGSLRSYANLAFRPTAGAFSLLTYPVRGALMSLNQYDTATERQLRQLRIDQGREAAEQTPEGREHTTSNLEVSETPTTEQPREEQHEEEEDEEEEEEEKEKKSSKTSKHVRRRDENFEMYLRRLHSTSADATAAPDSTSRAKIVELFKVASQKENLRKRKRAMQKRVQWIITKGGAASVSQVTSKERAYFAGGQIVGT